MLRLLLCTLFLCIVSLSAVEHTSSLVSAVEHTSSLVSSSERVGHRVVVRRSLFDINAVKAKNPDAVYNEGQGYFVDPNDPVAYALYGTSIGNRWKDVTLTTQQKAGNNCGYNGWYGDPAPGIGKQLKIWKQRPYYDIELSKLQADRSATVNNLTSFTAAYKDATTAQLGDIALPSSAQQNALLQTKSSYDANFKAWVDSTLSTGLQARLTTASSAFNAAHASALAAEALAAPEGQAARAQTYAGSLSQILESKAAINQTRQSAIGQRAAALAAAQNVSIPPSLNATWQAALLAQTLNESAAVLAVQTMKAAQAAASAAVANSTQLHAQWTAAELAARNALQQARSQLDSATAEAVNAERIALNQLTSLLQTINTTRDATLDNITSTLAAKLAQVEADIISAETMAQNGGNDLAALVSQVSDMNRSVARNAADATRAATDYQSTVLDVQDALQKLQAQEDALNATLTNTIAMLMAANTSAVAGLIEKLAAIQNMSYADALLANVTASVNATSAARAAVLQGLRSSIANETAHQVALANANASSNKAEAAALADLVGKITTVTSDINVSKSASADALASIKNSNATRDKALAKIATLQSDYENALHNAQAALASQIQALRDANKDAQHAADNKLRIATSKLAQAKALLASVNTDIATGRVSLMNATNARQDEEKAVSELTAQSSAAHQKVTNTKTVLLASRASADAQLHDLRVKKADAAAQKEASLRAAQEAALNRSAARQDAYANEDALEATSSAATDATLKLQAATRSNAKLSSYTGRINALQSRLRGKVNDIKAQHKAAKKLHKAATATMRELSAAEEEKKQLQLKLDDAARRMERRRELGVEVSADKQEDEATKKMARSTGGASSLASGLLPGRIALLEAQKEALALRLECLKAKATREAAEREKAHMRALRSGGGTGTSSGAALGYKPLGKAPAISECDPDAVSNLTGDAADSTRTPRSRRAPGGGGGGAPGDDWRADQAGGFSPQDYATPPPIKGPTDKLQEGDLVYYDETTGNIVPSNWTGGPILKGRILRAIHLEDWKDPSAFDAGKAALQQNAGAAVGLMGGGRLGGL